MDHLCSLGLIRLVIFFDKIFILLVQASYMSDRRKNHIRVKPVLRGHIWNKEKKKLNLKIFLSYVTTNIDFY